jgi:YlmC/YmxH family sporulation protein
VIFYLRINDLKQKEVININDGKRFGFVNDVEIDCMCGKIKKIIIISCKKFLGIFGKELEIQIPWNEIRQIGDDIILIDVDINEVIEEV